MVDSVALVKHEGDVGKALEEGIELLGGLGSLKSPFIIKPNICTGVDKTGFAVTNVSVVEALVDLVLKEDSNLSIKIVESDSESKFADEAFEKFGYTSLEQKLRIEGLDVSAVNLSRLPTVSVKLDGLYFKKFELPNVITGSKYFVSMAVAKTHYLTFVTGTLKNLFGLLPRKDQSFYHAHINDVIVDLNRLVRPDLCIVDARVGLEGWEGPKTRRLGTFIIGRKPVSVDATMARIMGFNPEKIRHLVKAEKYGLGTINPKVLGKSLKSTTVKFKPPSRLSQTALLN
ncbi:MAG: DUF362 domain-containing protein [Candidatus Bathyarchaeota archaeon]|nr:DUF362 domain-containing protein [Candidatus Bathyarchaeota archaeon]MDH5733200.1 DUF362 domain-containing protein [Candidatus Bathyarchaeota archaeon]